MTPFMLRIAELVGTEPAGFDAADHTPVVPTRRSERIATSTGADRDVLIRSLAEQLVSEANAVLTGGDEHLTLADEAGPGELAFTVGYRGRGARVSTTFSDGTAFGRLVGDGLASELPQELEGPDALPDLLVRLMLTAGLPHHPVHL